METNDKQIVEVLAARHFLYTLGQSLLGNAPDEEILESIDPDLVAVALEVVGVNDDGKLAVAISSASDDIDAAKALYTKLFVGPSELAAPPWESVYRTKRRALFQHETLEVRNAYRVQGFLPEAYPRVADDHIALELAFLAALAQRALDAAVEGHGDGVHTALAASADFLSEHLSSWFGEYAFDLEKAAPESLYSVLSSVLDEFTSKDIAFLERELRTEGFAKATGDMAADASDLHKKGEVS